MLPQRNPDGKGCSLAGIAGYADFSSVHLGNLSGNRQAKPKAATGTAGGCAIEAVKNMGQRCRRNGCAGVVYAQLKPLLLFEEGNRNLLLITGVFDGIVQQKHHHSADVHVTARITVLARAEHREVPALAWLNGELGLLEWMLAQQRLSAEQAFQ